MENKLEEYASLTSVAWHLSIKYPLHVRENRWTEEDDVVLDVLEAIRLPSTKPAAISDGL